MYIKLDENGKLTEVSTEKQKGFLDKEFDIDMSRFLCADYVDGKIVYSNKKNKKHAENRTIMQNLLAEEGQINDWLAKYDAVCNEHLRCERLGIDCSHNIAEWDEMAIEKTKRLKELKMQIERN